MLRNANGVYGLLSNATCVFFMLSKPMMLMACTAIHLGYNVTLLALVASFSSQTKIFVVVLIAFSMVADALHAAYMM